MLYAFVGLLCMTICSSSRLFVFGVSGICSVFVLSLFMFVLVLVAVSPCLCWDVGFGDVDVDDDERGGLYVTITLPPPSSSLLEGPFPC